jgi:hypothetical protein
MIIANLCESISLSSGLKFF